jgi:hypothetical protein
VATSVNRGTGLYNVDDPEGLAAILTGVVRRWCWCQARPCV